MFHVLFHLFLITVVFVIHLQVIAANLIGTQCKVDEDCPWAAFCVDGPRDTLVCQCRDGFAISSTKEECLPKIGNECISSLDCGENAYCAVDEERTCQCLDDSYLPTPSGYGCMGNKTLGSTCGLDVHCGQNTTCIDNQCACKSGYEPHPNLKDCSPYRQLLGYECSSSNQCGKGTICLKITSLLPIQWTDGPACNCEAYFRESSNAIDCEPDPKNQCHYHYQCPVNSWCGVNKCHCDLHFEDNGSGCQPVTYTKMAIIVVVSVVGVALILGIALRFWLIRRKKRLARYN